MEFNTTLIFLLLTTITFFLLPLAMHRRKKSGNLPPSPSMTLPIIGNLHQLGPLPHRALASLSTKHGPLIQIRLGSFPAVVVSSAEMAEEVMKTQDLNFATRPRSSIADLILYGSRDIAFSPYGEHWRRMRKICVLHLLSNKRVQEFRSVREEEVSLLLSNIRRASPSPVNLSGMLRNLLFDVISRLSFGKKLSEEEGATEMILESSMLLAAFPMKDFIPWLGWVDELRGLNQRVRKASAYFDAFFDPILDKHTHSAMGSVKQQAVNLIDVLMSLKEEEEEEDADLATLDRDCIKAFIWDMLSGGTDTTSAALVWAMANLIKHPASMRRAQAEVRRVVGFNSTVAEEDISEMKYLDAVIKETLRLYPSVPLLLPREAMKDTKLNGYDIPAGTRVLVNAWKIGRDNKYWDKPEEFYPERFLDKSFDFRGQDFQYIPFGAGRRGCPGITFGTIMIQYVLANLLHDFDWEIPKEMHNQVLDMTEISTIELHKKTGLVLNAKPYSSSFSSI
ncbi:Cytochrome P450 71A1 [Apostasia shenzhenica]|uniref:Cytochrome P450 71A1 n=1 Tax=Apostasia shenzhenica TaxID=1088818 RepID=A0A2I0A2V1_9ASPA|nr:Cytochrome P450 71A1 [Apostasia shenzhenica]